MSSRARLLERIQIVCSGNLLRFPENQRRRVRTRKSKWLLADQIFDQLTTTGDLHRATIVGGEGCLQ